MPIKRRGNGQDSQALQGVKICQRAEWAKIPGQLISFQNPRPGQAQHGQSNKGRQG